MGNHAKLHEKEAALAQETTILLEAIQRNAHFQVDDRLSEDHEHERADYAKSFRLKHKQEAKEAKETEKTLDAIRDHAHHKIEAFEDPERQLEREQLAKSFKLKHKQEAQQVKAARRRISAIRHGAHAQVADHLSKAEQRYEEQVHMEHNKKLREERRELKAHRRKFIKDVKSHAAPKVSAHLSKEIENMRAAQRARAQAQLQHSRQALKTLRSGKDGWKPTSAEVQFHAAVILQAARRGSLARTIATPQAVDEGSEIAPSPRLRNVFEKAKANRLENRRQAVFEARPQTC